MTKEGIPGSRRALGRLFREARADTSAEAIAERAGVGGTWYRWLEDGRNIGLSPTTLGWVADTLELSVEKRAEAMRLAGVGDALALSLLRAEPVPASLRRLLDGFTEYPAYITGRRLDVLAWNEPAEALYRCSTIPRERRNSFLYLFAQPDVRQLVLNWEEEALHAIAQLKSELELWPNDPWLLEVPSLLMGASAEFKELWRHPESTHAAAGAKTFDKGRFGRLVFEPEFLLAPQAPGLSMRVLIPSDASREGVQQLLAEHRKDAAAKRKSGEYTLVRALKEHIDVCYAREIPLDELAALVGTNKFRMVRAFTAEVGFPPHAYQLLVRIHHARRLLAAGESSVTTATAVGLTDPSHLHRHFKRLEGTTPGKYRRERMGNPSADALAFG